MENENSLTVEMTIKTSSVNETDKEKLKLSTLINNPKIKGYVKVDTELNPKYDYGIISVKGGCLDSDLSPIRIKDGDKVIIHAVPVTEIELINCIGKIVSIMLTNGVCIIKQAVFYNVINRCITVRMFEPKEQKLHIPVSRIKALFIVEAVLSAEYVRQNIIYPK